MANVREIDRSDDVYVGLEFPLDHNLTGFFRQTKTVQEQVKSNIKNLLLTSKGERVFQPDFGCDLKIVQSESNPNEITISLEYSTTLQPDALDSITFNLVVGE